MAPTFSLFLASPRLEIESSSGLMFGLKPSLKSGLISVFHWGATAFTSNQAGSKVTHFQACPRALPQISEIEKIIFYVTWSQLGRAQALMPLR